MKKPILLLAIILLPVFALAARNTDMVTFANFNQKLTEMMSGMTLPIDPPPGLANYHPLMSAVENNDIAEAAKHLKLINTLDKKGLTPLVLAVMLQHKEMVDFLLNNGARLDLPSQNDRGILTPVMAAAKGVGSRDTGKEILQSLLKADGMDIRFLEMADNHGWTALHIAAAAGFKDAVDLLLGAGAYINARDNKGITPLMAAIDSYNGWLGYDNFFKTVGFLAGYKKDGAPVREQLNINAVDNEGKTALMHAARAGDCGFMDILIGTWHIVENEYLSPKAIDIHIKDKEGKTAMQHAKNDGTQTCLREIAERYTGEKL